MVVRKITSLEAAKDDIHLRGGLQGRIVVRGASGVGSVRGKIDFAGGGVELDLFHRQ